MSHGAVLILSISILINSCSPEEDLKDKNQVFSENFNKKGSISSFATNKLHLSAGIEKKGIVLDDQCLEGFFEGDTSLFSASKDFTLSLWLKSDIIIPDTCIVISNSDFELVNAGIYGMRRYTEGITLFSCNGGWGWNIGNGRVHCLYDPMPNDQALSDGLWHHLALTHNAEAKEIRIFYDGINKSILKIGDMSERDFYSGLRLRLGESNNAASRCSSFPGIVDKLNIWSSTLSSDKIKELYSDYGNMQAEPEMLTDTLTIMNWNIWHGGTHFTLEKDSFDGIERIAELIKESGADIVLMQETYGAGPEISSRLGYYYFEASSTIGAVWGANLSVMSRYPFEKAFMVEERSNYGNNYAFNNGGVKIRLSENRSVIAFSNWYNGRKPEDLAGALNAWKGLIENSDNIPVIFGGDYNSVSHLDDGIGKSGHSKLMTEAGFTDSFRKIYPDPEKNPGYSGPGGYDRIDYIYYIGDNLELIDFKPLINGFRGREALHPGYPSDHLGIITKFQIK